MNINLQFVHYEHQGNYQWCVLIKCLLWTRKGQTLLNNGYNNTCMSFTFMSIAVQWMTLDASKTNNKK